MTGSRFLVTYSSGFGSTQGVAEKIASTLRDAGQQTDVVPADQTPDPSAYDAVIVGSPIRYDSWMPAAKDYVVRYETTLAARPVACFFTCMTLSVPSAKSDRTGQTYAARIEALAITVCPVSVGQFAGALDFRSFPALLRLPARVLFAMLGVRKGDYRDFDAVRDWTLQTLGQMAPTLDTAPADQPTTKKDPLI